MPSGSDTTLQGNWPTRRSGHNLGLKESSGAADSLHMPTEERGPGLYIRFQDRIDGPYEVAQLREARNQLPDGVELWLDDRWIGLEAGLASLHATTSAIVEPSPPAAREAGFSDQFAAASAAGRSGLGAASPPGVASLPGSDRQMPGVSSPVAARQVDPHSPDGMWVLDDGRWTATLHQELLNSQVRLLERQATAMERTKGYTRAIAWLLLIPFLLAGAAILMGALGT